LTGSSIDAFLAARLEFHNAARHLGRILEGFAGL